MKSIRFKICFTTFVVGAIILTWVDQVKPSIIAFELARTIENAYNMLEIWESAGVLHLKKFSLYFDYVFILGYAGSLFIVWREWWRETDKKWVYYLGFLPVIAGFLDGIENFGLLQIVYYQGTQFSASLAFCCASVKFILLVPSILGALYYLALNYMKKV
jgi:hypothetical protein